jgi:two-component system NtrC family sensor kinase
VNNPLSSISAYAQLLLRDDGLSEGQRDSVEVIKSEALRASQVVKDLLSFARRSTPQSEPVHLNQVVERSLRLRNYQLASSNVAVALSLAPDLPPVTGDARQLQQVVLNLITNSIQAMSSIGGGTLRLTTRVEGRNVLLEVSDTGRGIPASARMRVFEPFYTTKQEGEGTGLGLSVSYGIVTAHGGSISITQSSPSGTTFVVALPAGAATAGAGPAVEPPLPGPRSALAGTRVLFVDDEASLRSGMEAFGRLRGFAVATAEDGETAMAAVQTRSFDAVVCDLRMPGMDGVSFHQALRRERPGLARRTIFITGDVLSGTARYTAAVRQPTLTKPFTFERLEEALVAVMRGRAVG